MAQLPIDDLESPPSAAVCSWRRAATRQTWLLELRTRSRSENDAQNTRDLRELSTLVTALEEERRLIGCKLHYEVGQALTSIKVEIAVAERDVAAS